MKQKMILAGLAAVCVAPVFGVLGIGDIVYDPTNFEEAVQQVLQLEQQYAQLVQTYRLIESQYEQMVRMAKQDPVNMFLRYRALRTPWTPSSATNTYGTTAGWSLGINTGQNVSAGYSAAVQHLGTYGNAFGNIPADQADRIKASYATVELTMEPISPPCKRSATFGATRLGSRPPFKILKTIPLR